jgi:rRNA maturation RNase YbeY
MSVRLSGPPRRPGGPAPDRALLARRARAVLRAVGHARSELSLALVDDAAIAALNERDRGKAGPTDVLSYSLLEGPHSEQRGALLGDVVISLHTALRQARRYRRPLEDEVLRLLIHGALHLIGYDHVRTRDALVMRREERRVWRAVRARAAGARA